MLKIEDVYTIKANDIGANEPTEDELVESLKASNRELARQLANLRDECRRLTETNEKLKEMIQDDYKVLYKDLIDQILDRVKQEP